MPYLIALVKIIINQDNQNEITKKSLTDTITKLINMTENKN